MKSHIYYLLVLELLEAFFRTELGILKHVVFLRFYAIEEAKQLTAVAVILMLDVSARIVELGVLEIILVDLAVVDLADFTKKHLVGSYDIIFIHLFFFVDRDCDISVKCEGLWDSESD